MQCDRLMLMVGYSFLTLYRGWPTDKRRFWLSPLLCLPILWLLSDCSCRRGLPRLMFTTRTPTIILVCVTILVILVVWFLLPTVARLMIHTPTAISIFVCLSMVQLMAVLISMRCTLCAHFLQVALTLILVVGYAIAAS